MYANLVRQKLLAEAIVPRIRDAGTAWLCPPDPAGVEKMLAWTQAGRPEYVFVANFDTQERKSGVAVPAPPDAGWELFFSTVTEVLPAGSAHSGQIHIPEIGPGEGIVFRRVDNR